MGCARWISFMALWYRVQFHSFTRIMCSEGFRSLDLRSTRKTWLSMKSCVRPFPLEWVAPLVFDRSESISCLAAWNCSFKVVTVSCQLIRSWGSRSNEKSGHYFFSIHPSHCYVSAQAMTVETSFSMLRPRCQDNSRYKYVKICQDSIRATVSHVLGSQIPARTWLLSSIGWLAVGLCTDMKRPHLQSCRLCSKDFFNQKLVCIYVLCIYFVLLKQILKLHRAVC